MNLRNLDSKKVTIVGESDKVIKKYFAECFKVLTKTKHEISSVELDVHSDRFYVPSPFVAFPKVEEAISDLFIVNEVIRIVQDHPKVHCDVTMMYDKDLGFNIFSIPNMEGIEVRC